MRRDKPSKKTQNTKSAGAQVATIGLSARFHAYRKHHLVSLTSSVKKLFSTPVQSLMTVLVVAIALALPATLLVALQNAQHVGQNLNAKPQLSVYINKRAKSQAIESYIEELRLNERVKGVVLISAQQALEQFKQGSGMGDVLAALDENPLPATLIVDPTSQALDPSILRALADDIKAYPIVDDVIFDMGWVRRLIDIMTLLETIVIALAGLLAFGILLAIGNTIRLEIQNRRAEIVVSKLVGGTNAFVRRPFLYTGLLYGVFGAFIAAFIVSLTLLVIDSPVARLAQSYQSGFQLEGLGIKGWMSLICIGAALGLMGAWLAVGRELSKIEP